MCFTTIKWCQVPPHLQAPWMCKTHNTDTVMGLFSDTFPEVKPFSINYCDVFALLFHLTLIKQANHGEQILHNDDPGKDKKAC